MANQSKILGKKPATTSPLTKNDELWAVLSKTLWSSLFKDTKRKFITGIAIIAIFALIKIRLSWRSQTEKLDPGKQKQGKGNVDMAFFRRIWKLIKIVIPNLQCQAVFDLIMLTVFLVFRTYLSIFIAGANGRIVKAIIQLNFSNFLKRIVQLGLLAVPASFVNSYLDFVNKRLEIYFRTRLTNYFNNLYIKDMIFYQLTNLDSRINNPDQRMTSDIEKWANSLSQIYSNFTKPLLDIILFSKKLSELVGWVGPVMVLLWYFLSGLLIKVVSPPFGRLTAISQRLEGSYRSCHNDLVHHSEEIAFYKGNEWEHERIKSSFRKLINHTESINKKRLLMGTFDSLLTKYGAVMIGYTVVGLPVFGPGSKDYLLKNGSDPSIITRDYVRNSSLLINLAKAIGRLVISYKEIQHLAGYTTLISEMDDVLRDLNNGQFERNLVSGVEQYGAISLEQKNIISLSKEHITETDNSIEFQNVPIVTPAGDKLVNNITVQIQPGTNVIVTGPNGCGKSSLFRILGGLWPIFEGNLCRPSTDKIFYIPQKVYLPCGTLRDQIIYPHNQQQMIRRKSKDEDLKNLLEKVKLEYLVEREGGFDAVNDWNDVLSGGEKQRIAMARLFYHKPLFAVLDECTSAVSQDVESTLYTYSKSLNITLFTVSHRHQIFKYHDYMLKFDGQKNWTWTQVNKEENIL